MDAQSTERVLDLKTEGLPTEIRRDYLHEVYVLVAPKRQNRPFDTRSSRAAVLVETASSPRLDLQTTVSERKNEAGTWTTKVVENKYPALTPQSSSAYGKQELVIDTPLRNVAFGELPVEQIHEVLLTYQERASELAKMPHIHYVAIFRNDGAAAGASLAHAHSQIVALPIIPPRLKSEAQTIDTYTITHKANPFESIIGLERKQSQRIIQETNGWMSFCPYASAWQMEVWILPLRQISRLDECGVDELKALAQHIKNITSQLTSIGVSYNLAVEQGVSATQRLTVKIRGRSVLSPRGGLEIMTDIIVNAIPPEAAADWYRRGLTL